MTDELYWAGTLVSSVICVGTGTLAWKKNPWSISTGILLIATITASIAMFSARVVDGVGDANPDLSTAFSKVFLSSLLLSTVLFWQISLTFPVQYDFRLRPPNVLGIVMIASIVISIGAGLIATPDFGSAAETIVVSPPGAIVIMLGFIALAVLSTLFTFGKRRMASSEAMHSGTIYVIGIWMVALSGMAYGADIVLGHRHGPDLEMLPGFVLLFIVTAMMLYFASLMVRGRATIAASPGPERLATASKARFNLLLRRVYLVEEPKSEFAMNLFTDVLKGRCYDCDNDESFECESIDCSSCNLPCPCKDCEMYKSRTQGLIITRLHPKELRRNHFLQTTPIIWLSSVPGRDYMDPAKLSLLTDFLVSSMEKSHNGVVLVDGVEYLISSNDFQRVLRAIDRWTETAMTSSTRLIITIDPRAFDQKDVAMLERNKEVVRPGASEAWRIIPEPI